MAFEAHQSIIGGVLIRLAPCGHSEGSVDESIDGTALMHHKLPHVDQLAGDLSDDVHAVQHFVPHPEHKPMIWCRLS